MKKQVKNNKYYLLGVRKEDGSKIYLEKPSWNCEWYWGFGYIEAFKKNKWIEYTHFDLLFLKTEICDSFMNYFSEITLNKDEVWVLLGYMKEFYVMQEYAELLKRGNFMTSKAISILEEKNKEKNLEEYNRINKILLPELFQKIDILLTNNE